MQSQPEAEKGGGQTRDGDHRKRKLQAQQRREQQPRTYEASQRRMKADRADAKLVSFERDSSVAVAAHADPPPSPWLSRILAGGDPAAARSSLILIW
jgi:hypothetical protein